MAADRELVEKLIYGTAWKGDRTANLVYSALKSGFRAIATAAQPKHYREELVGDGIREAISDGIVKRNEIFIQTTFTPYPSQDPANLPYDPRTSLEEQVQTSVANSLATLASVPPSSSLSTAKPYLDALILHVPYVDPQHTKQVWIAMSRAVRDGHVRQLGISNTSVQDLLELVTWCATKKSWPQPDAPDAVPLVEPSIVQNRFHPGPDGDFDRAVRLYCTHTMSLNHRAVPVITYQAFGFLQNKAFIQDKVSVDAVAKDLNVSHQVALYALVLEALSWDHRRQDIRVLVGTTKEERMREDLTEVGRAAAALRRAKSDPSDELHDAVLSFQLGLGD